MGELAEHGLVGRSARTSLGDEERGRQGYDQGGDLRDQPIADRQFREHVRRVRERHAVGVSRR